MMNYTEIIFLVLNFLSTAIVQSLRKEWLLYLTSCVFILLFFRGLTEDVIEIISTSKNAVPSLEGNNLSSVEQF